MSRRSATTTKVFVGSLPPGVNADDLRRLFEPYGEIAECDVVNRCGFLHMENKDLADKAIGELNNTDFKGGRITVEKGRSKAPPRDRERSSNGYGRSSVPRPSAYQGGPMRGSRENSRVGPYMRDGGGGGGDYDRRNGSGYGMYDADRGFVDMYGGSPVPLIYDERRGGYPDERHAYLEEHMYAEERRYYEDRRMGSDATLDHRSALMTERRAPHEHPYDDRRPLMVDRRPLLDHGGDLLGVGGAMRAPMPMPPTFDRRPQADMYNRRDGMSKPIEGGYDDASYDNSFPPLQQQRFCS